MFILEGKWNPGFPVAGVCNLQVLQGCFLFFLYGSHTKGLGKEQTGNCRGLVNGRGLSLFCCADFCCQQRQIQHGRRSDIITMWDLYSNLLTRSLPMFLTGCGSPDPAYTLDPREEMAWSFAFPKGCNKMCRMHQSVSSTLCLTFCPSWKTTAERDEK